MILFDEYGKEITYTGQVWVGGWFGIPAKQSLINSVLSKYLPAVNTTLLIDPYYQQPVLLDLILENRSDHYTDPMHYRSDRITLGASFLNEDSYFPFWLFFSKYAQLDDVYLFPDQRKHRVSCLNRNLRIQRVFNLVELSKRDYFNEIFITLNKFIGDNRLLDFSIVESDFRLNYQPDNRWDDFENNETSESIFWKLEKILGAGYINEFEKLYHTLPGMEVQSTNEYYHCSRVYETGWGNSYLNIVTEPQIDNIGFISEKVFKPIRAEQLFLIQGCPGTINYLQRIGFDTFSDYIDHNYYDNELDWKIRTQKMLEVLDNIYPKIPEIFAATKQRRMYNRQHLASMDVESNVLKTLLEKIERTHNDLSRI